MVAALRTDRPPRRSGRRHAPGRFLRVGIVFPLLVAAAAAYGVVESPPAPHSPPAGHNISTK